MHSHPEVDWAPPYYSQIGCTNLYSLEKCTMVLDFLEFLPTISSTKVSHSLDNNGNNVVSHFLFYISPILVWTFHYWSVVLPEFPSYEWPCSCSLYFNWESCVSYWFASNLSSTLFPPLLFLIIPINEIPLGTLCTLHQCFLHIHARVLHFIRSKILMNLLLTSPVSIFHLYFSTRFSYPESTHKSFSWSLVYQKWNHHLTYQKTVSPSKFCHILSVFLKLFSHF